jgi:hypothetical protein
MDDCTAGDVTRQKCCHWLRDGPFDTPSRAVRTASGSIHSCYNTPIGSFTGKEKEMLQQITIEIQDANQFASILRGALDRELRLVEYAIVRTLDRLREFESKFSMSTTEFERRFHPGDLEETLDFIEWEGEIETLRLLEEKRQVIQGAHIK